MIRYCYFVPLIEIISTLGNKEYLTFMPPFGFCMGYQVEDLSRMYRLFHKVPKGLEPVANMFKQVLVPIIFFDNVRSFDFSNMSTFCGCMEQHVISEGMILVQHAEDVASNKVSLSIFFIFYFFCL